MKIAPGFYCVTWHAYEQPNRDYPYVKHEAVVRVNDGGGWHSISEHGHIRFYVAGKSPEVAGGKWTQIEMTEAEWTGLLSLARQRQLVQGHVTNMYRRILGKAPAHPGRKARRQ